jgi:hypothetical protein
VSCSGQGRENSDQEECQNIRQLLVDNKIEEYCETPLDEEIDTSTFLTRLFCGQRCYSANSFIEDYFGIKSTGDLMIDYNALPSVLEVHSKLRGEKDTFYSDALQFYFSCIPKDERITRSCFVANILYMIIKDIRMSNGDCNDQQVLQLIKMYDFFKEFDWVFSDTCLDVLRRSSSNSAQEFVKGKKFKSDMFRSEEMIELHEKIGDHMYLAFL